MKINQLKMNEINTPTIKGEHQKIYQMSVIIKDRAKGIRLQKTIAHNKPSIGAEEIKAAADTSGNLELTVGTKVEEFEKA